MYSYVFIINKVSGGVVSSGSIIEKCESTSIFLDKALFTNSRN